MKYIRLKHGIALFPGSGVGGGKRAWYTLFMHAPSSLGNLHTIPVSLGVKEVTPGVQSWPEGRAKAVYQVFDPHDYSSLY